MSQSPTVGRIVLYTLNDGDASIIQSRRSERAITGNCVSAGDVFPAIVVRVFPGATNGVCNLQVILDGEDTYWATSRVEGTEPCTWAWPVRV